MKNAQSNSNSNFGSIEITLGFSHWDAQDWGAFSVPDLNRAIVHHVKKAIAQKHTGYIVTVNFDSGAMGNSVIAYTDGWHDQALTDEISHLLQNLVPMHEMTDEEIFALIAEAKA